MRRRRRRGRWRDVAGALVLLLVLSALGRIGSPTTTFAQTGDDFGVDPDSARLDSIAADSARADSIAQAEGGATFGGPNQATLELIGSNRPDHPFSYNTGYTVLRNRKTWTQDADFYYELNGLAMANRTTIVISDDPDVQRSTRNRGTAFELGYAFFEGLTTGLRLSIDRSSDIIGIRLQNSILRDEDNLSAFARYEKVVWKFPLVFDLSGGGRREVQPEFSRSGTDFGLEMSTIGPLLRNLDLSLGGIFTRSNLVSETPQEGGPPIESNDRSFDRSARAGLTWRPLTVLNVALNTGLRRGQLQRPEANRSGSTDSVVTEQVNTDAENANLSVRYTSPFGGSINASGRISNTEILYAVDSTRTNITQARSMNVNANERIWGTAVRFTFSNGITESDYTRRQDGYIQNTWARSMEVNASRPLNPRTTANLRGAIALTSRRFTNFRPSSDTSFPPPDQDLLNTSGAIGVDYRPWQKFTTGLEGRVRGDRTINLTTTSSINNTDQTAYDVIWSWTATPWAWWTVTQNNSAGANQIAYPFAPDRDQLSFIYQLRTGSTFRVTSRVELGLNYNVRFQSRGSFRKSVPGSGDRKFGKSGGSEQYDLLVRVLYRPTSWLNGEVSNQSFISRNLSDADGEDRIDSETRRNVFTLRLGANYTFLNSALLTLDIRKVISVDETEVNTIVPTPPTQRDDDYWQVRSSFRTFFDF